MSGGGHEEVFRRLVEDVRVLDPIPIDPYVRRLHNKSRNSDFARTLKPFISTVPKFPQDDPDPDSYYMDEINIRDLLNEMSDSTSVIALSRVHPSRDKYDFASSVHPQNAQKAYEKVILSLASYCFGEHLNQGLRSKGSPTLHDLKNRYGFLDYVKGMLQEDRFIRAEIATDLFNGHHQFSLAMLYIIDYFKYGGANGIPAYNEDYWNRPSYEVVGAWSWRLWEDNARNSKETTDKIVQFCGKSATSVFAPSKDNPKPQPLFTVTKNLYAEIGSRHNLSAHIGESTRAIDDNADYVQAVQQSLERLQLKEDIINEWEAYCMALKNAWTATMLAKWEQGIGDGLQDQYSYQTSNGTMVVTGEPVHKWISDGFGYEEYSSGANRPWRMFRSWPNDNRELVGGGGSCFRAGTKITLADGKTAKIEELSEWDRILTLAEPEQYGVMSDERVSHHIDVSLVGFNGETPFATPAHIFHTTTGLRAVDPRAAIRENPWIKVGQLAVGHFVYRLDEGYPHKKGYEAVEIKSLEQTSSASRMVYGVHLRQGLRSYHANGFLVALNYPEITTKSISNQLKKFSARKRLSLVRHIQELRPLFERFGAQTVCERLSMELYDTKRIPLGRNIRSTTKPLSFASPGAQLTALAQAESQKPCGVRLENLIRTFRLVSRKSSRFSHRNTLPEITIMEGQVSVDGTVQPKATINFQDRSVCWSRKLSQTHGYEHGMLYIHVDGLGGDGVLLVSPEAEPQTFSENDTIPVKAVVPSAGGHDPSVQRLSEKRLFSKNAARLGPAPKVDDEGGSTTILYYYSMTFDKAVWDPDVKRSQPVSPISGGLLGYGYYLTSEGLRIPTMTVPFLDQLRDRINDLFYQGETKLDAFYTTTFDITSEGDQRAAIQLNQAAFLPFISDTGEDFASFNLSFKETLGIDLTLPCLYQSLYVDFDWLYENLTGALYAYDPIMRGMKGNRHFVSGVYQDDMRVSMQRAKFSRAMAAFAKPGIPNSEKPELQPASITKSLWRAADPDLQRLMELKGYDERAVHNASQNLIQSMMYWHMDDDQREKFTNQSKPVGLDPELTTNLPAKLKAFFRDKYGPAFISRSIAGISSYRDKLTNQERKNLWYWWQGNGKTCLSQSQEYSDINNIASRWAMRRLYGESTLNFFLSSGGTMWADKLYDSLKRKPIMTNLLNQPMSGQNNLINKYCATMNTLSPGNNKVDQWFEDIVAYSAEIGINYPYIDEEKEVAGQWLHDSMQQLIIKILLGDPEITAEVRDALLKDLEEFERANGLDQSQTAQRRAANIMEKSAILNAELVNWVTAVGKGLKKALEGVTGWTWANSGFRKAIEKVGGSMTEGKLLKGISTICIVGFYVGQITMNVIGLVDNWDKLQDSQKAVVILETIRIAVDGAKASFKAWEKFKNGTAAGTEANVGLAKLNQSTQKVIRNSGAAFDGMASDLHGQLGMENSVSNKWNGNGPPVDGDQLAKAKETWNESKTGPAEGAPPGGKDASKKFSMKGNYLKLLNVALGIGVAVAMTFSLVHDWNNLNDTGKVINTLSVVVQALTVLVDIASLGASLGIITGAFAAALPIIGAILAVIGIVLMFLGMFLNLYASTPPPDPVGDFVRDYAKPLIRQWDNAPLPKLSYTFTPSSLRVGAGTATAITIEGKNNTSQEVNVTEASVTITSGDDEGCLYTNETFELLKDTDPIKDQPGKTYVTPGAKIEGLLSESKIGSTNDFFQFDLRVRGTTSEENPLRQIVLKPGESFRSLWKGIVNAVGRNSSESSVDIVETFAGDRSNILYYITRF